MNRNKVLLTAAAVSIIGVGSLAATAQAQGDGNTLVDKISQKFHVDKNEVQKVFDEDRASHQAEHQQKYEEMLNQAVKDGKLTQAQKDMVLAKHNELKKEMEQNRDQRNSERDEMSSKTESERQQLMEQRRTEMDKKKAEIEKWEKDNGIPSGYLMPRMGMGPGGPGGHGHGMGGF